MSELVERYQDVKARITRAAEESHRPASEVTLLAVSKKHSIDAIDTVAKAGQRHFGENYLQEALEKIEQLATRDLIWHFIGPIQSNKTRAIAEHFDWVHSVDRLKVASRLSQQRPGNLPPINLCIQVNIDGEDSKSGVELENVPTLAHDIAQLPNIRLRGLMAIPDPKQNVANAFAKMKNLFESLADTQISPDWDTLSMGMSADLALAIQHGATIVRVGSDIFGPRE